MIIKQTLTRIEPVKELTDEKLSQLTDPNSFRGAPIGLESLDKILFGIKPGLYVFSAVRGSGKTWFGLQLTRGLFQSSGIRTVFFTLEMTTDQLIQRCLQSWSGLTEEALMAKVSTSKGEELLKQNFLQFYPAYEGSFDYETFEAAIEQATADGFKFFILDHLHLVKGASSQDSLNILANWANESKKLAARLGITICLIAQPRKLNNLGKIVTADDIKGTGAVVDAADVVLTVSRERKDPREPASKECFFSVEKNRLGGKMYEGTTLIFRNTGEFSEMSYIYGQEVPDEPPY